MELAFTILNFLGLGGVAIYLYFVLSGLKVRIDTLQKTVNAQKETLDAVRERADEFSRLSQGYKQALEDFESMGRKLEERRQELVRELEEANERKDQKLIEFRELEIKEIELKKKSLEALPELENRLKEVIGELETKMEILKTSDQPKSDNLNATLLALALSRSSPSLLGVSPMTAKYLSMLRKSKSDKSFEKAEPNEDNKTDANKTGDDNSE